MEAVSSSPGPWLIVLPDSEATAGIVSRLRSRTAFTRLHASGRPWVIGSDPARIGGSASLVHAEQGRTRLLVTGSHSLSQADLTVWARRIRHLADVDRLAASLAGSAHVVASVDGQVRAQGTVSGVRRVYYASVDGTTVAADRADLLAALKGASLDRTRLTARLLAITPSALIEPLWSGTEAVPADSWLQLGTRGDVRISRWWQPPPQELDRASGAPALARALHDAVAARVPTGATIGSDLSGGLDSTPMSFLASRATESADGKLITVRIGVADPTHDDHIWAAKAQELLDGGHVSHTVFQPGELPDMFEAVARPVPGLDEPTRWIRPVARLRETARRLGDRGAVIHLTGHGGDEVLPVKPNYLHDLMRRRPALAREHLAGMRALRRWPLAGTMRALAERRPYPQWLAQQADDLGNSFPPGNLPLFGWEYPLRLPPWVEREAVAELAGLVRSRAENAESYAPTRSAHTTIDLARQLGSAVRLAETITAREGAVLQAPYLDDRVIEACLAVRPEERSSPWSYKPLMVEAMRDTMPSEALQRATKGEFSDDFFKGQKRHRNQMAELFDKPLLAELGLIDADVLRHMALAAYPPGLPWSALDAAMAAENWLRAQDQAQDWRFDREDNRVNQPG